MLSRLLLSPLALSLCFAVEASAQGGACAGSGKNFALVLHGGAGAWELAPEKRRRVFALVRELLARGREMLRSGQSGMDTVEMVVRGLEDSGLLNAGKGSVRTTSGVVEMDASVMDGKTLKAGAVAGVRNLKNPIHAARLVMERTRHVMLIGEGAETVSASHGATVVDPSYFNPEEAIAGAVPSGPDHEYGTVGAVALDCAGNLVAATSTGGIRGKLPGRVGDSPVIGAGTYADNGTCAVSGTGDGEFFIRATAARDVAARMEFAKQPLEAAARDVVAKIKAIGGTGGIIALDRAGNVAMPFSTPGMLRGHVRNDEEAFVSID